MTFHTLSQGSETPMVAERMLQRLMSAEGARLLSAIRESDPQPASVLSLSRRMRKEFDPDLVAAALTLHELRVKAASKFSRANEMWLTRAGLEQATSESIARHRARRYAGLRTVADLCCGIGGDLIALAAGPDSGSILAVDRDRLHLEMARANAELYAVPAEIRPLEADVRDVGLAGVDGVFIDPARRTGRGRTVPGASEPPLDWCVGLVDRVPAVGIKAAPGIPHDIVPGGWGVEMIALGADLKEAVLWSPAMSQLAALATVIRDDRVHTLEPVPGDPLPIRAPEPGDVFLDPNPAVTRAGLVEDLARVIGAARIDDRVAFLVSGCFHPTPFARSLRVVASGPWNEKALRARLRELDAGPIDIRRRGLAGDVDAITKRLRMDGTRPFTIAMTRMKDRPWAVICEEIRA